MKTIIAGSRDATSYISLLNAVKESNISISTIVSGGARGADKLGELYATRNNIPLQIYRANWDMYGKRAGHIRNRQMAECSEALIALWDGKSKGTQNMINVAKELNLKVFVYYV